jgi:hypothetical protein
LLLAAALLPGLAARPLHAHGGGDPVLTREPIGDHLLYVWSNPASPRAGETAHITVGVTLPDGPDREIPVIDAAVEILARNESGREVRVEAEPGASGGVYYEADLVLDAGLWSIEVAVTPLEGAAAAAQFAMQVQAASNLRTWLVWLGIAGIVVGVALYGIAIVRARRKAAPVPQ